MTASAIVDIDGTLCTCMSEVWAQHNGNWPKIIEHCETVAPIPQMVELVRELCWHYHVELMTSRSEKLRDVTVRWMKAHEINFWRLTMRAVTDTTPDHIAKIEWAKALDLTPENVSFVMEDKDNVVNAWRNAGYIVLQPFKNAKLDAPLKRKWRWPTFRSMR
jgi:uncharacterized HAD superfamily protein